MDIEFLKDSNQIVLFVVLICFCMFTGAYIFYKISTFLRLRLFAKRMKRGEVGEEIGKAYLIKHGFTIIEEQPRESSIILIDGVPNKYNVRADFLVERKGRRSIVEVKTGNVSTNPTSTNSRRQLLEYSHIYDVDDLLFFDAESKKLQKISFPDYKRSPVHPPLITIFIIGVIIGAASVALFFWLK